MTPRRIVAACLRKRETQTLFQCPDIAFERIERRRNRHRCDAAMRFMGKMCGYARLLGVARAQAEQAWIGTQFALLVFPGSGRSTPCCEMTFLSADAMKRLWIILLLLVTLTLTGTAGFRVCSGAAWVDCLYMAVITLSTVGYTEAVPLGTGGKLFVVGFLMTSLSVFTYSAFQLGQEILSLRMRTRWEKRRMQSVIEDLKNHFIVCGFGRMGRAMCEYLDQYDRPFVIIDLIPEHFVETCQARGWIYLIGDATDDEVLMTAGIERASALASALHSDADNVYVALSARLLNQKLQIISRASDEKAVSKMQRAGADRVISPFNSAGTKMARMMLHPSIEDFIEIADDSGNDLELADVQIDESSPYIDCRLAETDMAERGVMVIGIRRRSGERLMPPPGNALICSGDSLFVFGTAAAVNGMICNVAEAMDA